MTEWQDKRFLPAHNFKFNSNLPKKKCNDSQQILWKKKPKIPYPTPHKKNFELSENL